MSKTVSELAQELGLSKQYLNRILSQNNLGRKSGNKKVSFRYGRKHLYQYLRAISETRNRKLKRKLKN